MARLLPADRNARVIQIMAKVCRRASLNLIGYNSQELTKIGQQRFGRKISCSDDS